MVRLFADEDFPRSVADQLVAQGHDVSSVQAIGLAGKGTPDEEVLDIASRDSRAVLTINRWDFIRLHRKTRGQHAGIVATTNDQDRNALARRIHDAIIQHPSLQGLLIRVNLPPTPSSRKRRGPLRP